MISSSRRPSRQACSRSPLGNWEISSDDRWRDRKEGSRLPGLLCWVMGSSPSSSLHLSFLCGCCTQVPGQWAVWVRVVEGLRTHDGKRLRTFERPWGGYGDHCHLVAVTQHFGGERLSRLGMDQADQIGHGRQCFTGLHITCDEVLILKLNADAPRPVCQEHAATGKTLRGAPLDVNYLAHKELLRWQQRQDGCDWIPVTLPGMTHCLTQAYRQAHRPADRCAAVVGVPAGRRAPWPRCHPWTPPQRVLSAQPSVRSSPA